MDEIEHAEVERLRTIFPHRLGKALLARRMSRAHLAEAIGAHANTVYAYTVGKRFPKVSQLVIIARVLDCSLEWLLGIGKAQEPTAQPTREEIEILEYVEVENGRGHLPTSVEVSHACESDSSRANKQVQKLLKLKLLQSSGLQLTKAGKDLIRHTERVD